MRNHVLSCGCDGLLLDALPKLTQERAHAFVVRISLLEPVQDRQFLTRLHSSQIPSSENRGTSWASLERVNCDPDPVHLGNKTGVSEWQEMAETLVELDIQIEELDGWATRREDIDKLKGLEALRDELRFALTHHHVPRRLRWRLLARDAELRPATDDPRD